MSKKIILTITFIMSAFFLSAQETPSLGSEWKGEILKGTALFTPGGMVKAGELIQNGQKFSIGLNSEKKIMYIETKSPDFLVNGIGVGKKLNEFTRLDSVKINKSWGGGYVKVNDDWYAAFDLKNLANTSKVLFLFQFDMPKKDVSAVRVPRR